MGEKTSSFATLSWDESGQPISTRFDDVYFSQSNGLKETQYVFLEANKLAERWGCSSKAFTIAETGFGTGLNFLATWDLWQKTQPAATQLHFLSVEKYPLRRQDLIRALALWPELKPMAQALLDAYPPQPASGLHRMLFDGGKVILDLYFGEASEGFSGQLPLHEVSDPQDTVSSPNYCHFGPRRACVDAWFLDGFAPSKNPGMWSQELFECIRRLSGHGTTFSTFTAAGNVRRSLSAAGFACKKRKGFGHKREMLWGDFEGTDSHPDIAPPMLRNRPADESWLLTKPQNSITPPNESSVLIIGGGIAGCHTANALARRGCKVTIIERADTIAAGASSNAQGVVYGKLSPHSDALSEFNLFAQIFANHYYQAQGLYKDTGAQCGVLHLAYNEKHTRYYQALAEKYSLEPQFLRWLPRDETERVCGIELKYPALYLEQGGWLSPQKLCEALVLHENITTRLGHKVASLSPTYAPKSPNQTGWRALDERGDIIGEAEVTVIANAHEATLLEQTQHLPLKRIRGQISYLPPTIESGKLRSVVCGEGYIAPSDGKYHSLGATFNLTRNDAELCPQEHRDNLARLEDIAPRLDETSRTLDPYTLGGKVGFRCTTPDYFPIIGPVPNAEGFVREFSILGKKANAMLNKPGEYWPNLYCNIGHGSRGLCYTPLGAELLASIICGEPMPLQRQLYKHLHPARFLIRNLIKNKIKLSETP